HKSTVFRLLATLEEHGLVEQNPSTEKYRLGYGLVRLAGSVVAEVDLSRAARPVLEELALRTGETVNLAILQGNQVINIDQIAAPERGRAPDGRVQAAVSVAGPSYRVTPQRLNELGEVTREAGEAISRRMGYIPGGGEA